MLGRFGELDQDVKLLDRRQIAAVAIKGGLKKSEVGAMHYVFPTIGGAIFDTIAS